MALGDQDGSALRALRDAPRAGRPPLPLGTRVWILPVAFALHEAEEWYILSWYRAHWTNVGALTERTVRTWLVFVSFLGFGITWIATRARSEGVVAGWLLLFFGFPFVHGFLHVWWVFYFGAYSPGVVTSVLLLLPTYAWLARAAVRARVVPAWFVLLAVVLNLPPAIGAVRMGDALPAGGLPFYRLSAAHARLLFGTP